MKKIDLEGHLRISVRREKKRLKRLRSRKSYFKHFNIQKKLRAFYLDHDKKVVQHTFFSLSDFLFAKDFHAPKFSNSFITIPETFGLHLDYDKSLQIIKRVVSNLKELDNNVITLDFTKCKKVDSAALFLLNVIISEHFDFYKKLDLKLKILRTIPKLEVLKSKNDEVNIQLLLSDLIIEAEGNDTDHVPISSIGLIKGNRTRKHYLESTKGIVATQIVEYVNVCLKEHEVEINPVGKNDLGGIISEILNNAEDHSPFTAWYASASFLQVSKKEDSNIVGELNLSFLNFGYTIFEGFEGTEKDNVQVYSEMEKIYNAVKAKYPSSLFTKENLFTLYALQDGFSRLKFESISRGTGTMKFLNSFMTIGDYENKELGFTPCLSITSGNTRILTDTTYKSFKKDDLYFISLNKEKDLYVIPDKSHLEQKQGFFPGTILSVRIFLNKEHLREKIKSKK